jgi:phosphoribosylformimino-5-aminoimidazole carboxamide ribotide isomerase
MRILPAVDVKGGRCVRLFQGDMSRETVFSDDPAAMAQRWMEAGAQLVHVVDLDGAVAGRPRNLDIVRRMVSNGVAVEYGGGVRTEDTVREMLDTGVTRIVIGTAAHRSPEFVSKAVDLAGDGLVVGIDARDGRVAVEGWTSSTETDARTLAKQMEARGVARIVYTDIARDGAMSGPNIEQTGSLAEAVSIPVTASGGIASLEDVRQVSSLERVGVDEMIIGRALYEGAFTYEQAMKLLEGKP